MLDNAADLRPPRPVFLVVLVFVVLVVPKVGACSMPAGWRPLSDIERVMEASVVLYGRVQAVYPDHRFNYNHSEINVYTAYVEVYCIMKGARSEQFVNISEAGYIPGLCHSTNLTVGHSYVILASHDQHGEYRTADGELDASDRTRLATACGLQAVYPHGVNESTATMKCPTPSPTGHCTSSGSREKSQILWIFIAFFLGIMLHYR